MHRPKLANKKDRERTLHPCSPLVERLYEVNNAEEEERRSTTQSHYIVVSLSTQERSK